VGRAAIADSHAPAELTAAMARYAAAPILAIMAAPIIGGFITDHFGWRGIFAFLLGLGVVILVLVGRGLSETVPAGAGSAVSDGGTARGQFSMLMRSRAFWACMGQSSLHFAVAVGFVASAPYLVQSTLGLGATEYGLGVMTIILGLLAGVFAAGRLAHRVSPPRQVLAGSVVGFAGSLLLPAALQFAGLELSAALLFGPTVLVAVGIGLAMPASQAGIVGAVPGTAGTAAGLSSCLQLVLAALFVHLEVLAWPRPDLAIGWITAIGMVIAVAFSAMVMRQSLCPVESKRQLS
jgi:DHA1 family bicyclomycin/chloramphenicol resistance-like MFS transporter